MHGTNLSTIAGLILQGQSISDHKFNGVSTLSQLKTAGLSRPSVAENFSGGRADDADALSKELRAEVNRRFGKARMENASDYSSYIEAVEHNGRPGGTPAITLFHQERLDVTEQGIIVPYGAVIVAIDGETQVEARHILKERLPKSGDKRIAFTIYHGIGVDVAKQILHDYNMKGLRWTESKAARYNSGGNITKTITGSMDDANIQKSAMNVNGGKATKKTHFSMAQALSFSVGAHMNGRGLTSAVSTGEIERAQEVSDIDARIRPALTEAFKLAVDDKKLGAAPSLVWQVAGVLSVSLPARTPKQLNWAAGIDAYAKSAVNSRGGARMSVKERLAAIAAAMV
jgi:hypothetical protein